MLMFSAQNLHRGSDLGARADAAPSPTWITSVHSPGVPTLAKLVRQEDRRGNGQVRIIYQDQKCLLAEVLPAS
jgi:hypothetical protein